MTEKLIELLKEKNYVKIKSLVRDLYPADLAALLETLEPRDITLIFRLLPKELAAETFTFMENDNQMHLISSFSDKELREMLDEIFVDDTVDIIEEMPANVVSRILRNSDSETRKQINAILNYPADSAGSVMTTEYVYFHKEMTTREALEWIRKVGFVKETIYTCYVTESRKLIGYVTILDLVTADEDVKIKSIMDTNVIYVNTHEDQEDAAKKISKYDLLAMPVVDNDCRIVGIITADDAMDVIRDEDTEDIEIMAAMLPSEKPYMKTGIFSIYKQRIPWLMLLMVSATFTGMILSKFENALAVVPALTIFIPMLMDTGGNSGSQASVTVIRGISLGEINFSDILKVMWKELRVGALCAASIAIVVFGKVILIDQKGFGIAAIVSATMFFVITTAKLVGCSLPLFAKKLGFDPAVMASPFITTIVDAISLLVYFFIASNVLHL